MKDIRVIATAYACEPDTGSETGIGWNVVREVARHEGVHVTVITRRNNRREIERALAADPISPPEFVYYDPPKWMTWWKRGGRGVQLFYYMWQIGAARLVAQLHAHTPFDCSHHVTFGRYWSPSFLPRINVPFVWGPVGGGESFPDIFRREFSFRNRAYERARDLARWTGEHDPAVRRAAQSCSVGFAATRETAGRLSALGVKETELLGNAALSRPEHERLAALPAPPSGPIRFISAGRLLHWKGFDLGIRGLASSGVDDAEYWILGDGPHREELERLANELQVSDRVRFWGNVKRDQVIDCLKLSHAMLHPSLHDSGGWACIEAMAAARPVICLDLGGPAVMVDATSGIKIEPDSPGGAVNRIAEAIAELDADRDKLAGLGRAASARVRDAFSWEAKAEQIVAGYYRALGRAKGQEVEQNEALQT